MNEFQYQSLFTTLWKIEAHLAKIATHLARISPLETAPKLELSELPELKLPAPPHPKRGRPRKIKPAKATG